MILRYCTLALLLVLTATASLLAESAPDMQVRIVVESKTQLEQLQRLGLDIVQVDKASVDILVDPGQLRTLRDLGFETETIHESAGEFYRSRLPEMTMGGYKTLAEIDTWLDNLIADHPTLVSAKQSIGTTIEGRNLWAVRISDNPNVDEDEPEVLFTAAIHSREVATPEVLMYFMDHLTTQYALDPEIKDLVDNREIWLILVCNPDGYYYNQVISPYGGGLWRRNRRDNGDGTFGIDLNRNFGYAWGYDNTGSSPTPGSETYRGTGPFSEPETQALRDFEIAHEFVLSNYYHSTAGIVLIPWAYVIENSADDDLFRSMGDSIQALCGYTPGLAGELLYTVNGGSFDWEYGEQTLKNKILAMSIEVGVSADGFWPTMARLATIREENLEPLLFQTRIAGRVNSLRAPTPPAITGLPASVDGTGYSVSWLDSDTANPGVQYELIEMQNRRIALDPADNLQCWSTDGFTLSTARAYSSPGSFFSGAVNGHATTLTTSLPYTVQEGDTLSFMTYYDLEPMVDFGYVEVSTDGRTFVSIPGDITFDFDPYGYNRGNGISGSSEGWIRANFDLAALEGLQVWFRFTYQTDVSITSEGWYVDDIYPHLVFDLRNVVAGDLTTPSYSFVDRPMGAYTYSVRSKDAQGQWSEWSATAETDVLGTGTGDPDLDGIASSVSDLALFSLFFKQGLPAFTIYPTVQVGETDFNCDGLTLSVNDLNTLSAIVVGSTAPCYPSGAPNATRDKISASAAADKSARRAGGATGYAVALNNTTFIGSDSVIVDIVLTEADASLVGYQFRIEYDASVMSLAEVRRGDGIPAWQHFDSHGTVSGGTGEVVLAAVAQFQGANVAPEAITFSSTPAQLARLKFQMVAPDLPATSLVRFAWEACGDNALVSGAHQSGNLQIDSLGLSFRVFDADGAEITGENARYGGADYTCFYGLFGALPAAVVDFGDTRVIYEAGCCLGSVGDVNGEGGDDPTISDISMLIDHLFISNIELPCLGEADVNISGGSNPVEADITIGDISMLIDHLFISQAALPTCP